jgi:uncharacterized membrane protein
MGKAETLTATETTPRQEIHQGASLRRTTMLRKLTLALVAAASLSAMALAPTAASAGGWGGGGWGFGGFHHHFGGFRVGYIGGGYVDDGCYVVRRVPTPYGYRLRTINVCQ